MAVTYIPSQLEAPSQASLTLRSSPTRLLLNDLKLIVTLARWIPQIFLPLRSRSKYAESHPTLANLRDLVLHATLLVLTPTFFITGARVALLFPGWISSVYLLVFTALLLMLSIPLNAGPRILHSKTFYPPHPGERWLFVNGVCAGTTRLQENLDSISSIFHRPIVGIHNRTYGLVFDLLECMAQRDFGYMTGDIRATYNKIKEVLLEDGVEKVVVLAHSQGGLIVGATVDALCADLPPATLERLEIYTFGNAANHFSNPPRCVHVHNANGSQTTLSNYPSATKRQIPIIEHYANQKDFVANLGVLNFVRTKEENEFVGKVFVWLEKGGHLFWEHYLEPMFGEDSVRFLDQRVTVETVEELQGDEGKTVRKLSTLWWYKDGGVPPGEA
ncbi:hypothetical protein FN846DRAFT_938118 [Sphaerosporella brunnea]|uniref:Alpha/Beta hydrolase protein n=1 Tax=Sphaerosporella brunnea TaxID=1250544 RepID=A0A5J5F309_9PEZI|nr:hypothetical protein FN846DRAFT_938118 [Sphaerosporella brunnea]